MAKKTLKELKQQISDILVEAKKMEEKESKKVPPQVKAFGHYDDEHNFARALGSYNSAGEAANWGPSGTGGAGHPGTLDNLGPNNPNANPAGNQLKMRESDEKALRALVREVIENGLIDQTSAWSPFLKKTGPVFESTDRKSTRLNSSHT